jgi:hypothetical protein
MYTDVFERLCAGPEASVARDFSNSRRLDGAVYMMWDMDFLECAAMSPGGSPLSEIAFEVLASVLRACAAGACLKSALHGLGHIHVEYPDRTQAMIDTFLAERRPTGWLKEYALQAREGAVQ